MKLTVSVLLILSIAAPAFAALHTEQIDYKQGDTALKGYLVYNDATDNKRPGILVVHEWWGLNEYAKKRANQLAELGYVAFAVDMYGEGKVTEHTQQAGEWAMVVGQDPETAKARFLAGYQLLTDHKLVDGNRIAAIGYCFGGGVVLKMALTDINLRGAVSFHGSLPGDPIETTDIRTKILVCHGASDAFVKPEQIKQFQENLTKAGVDWQFIAYGGAKHSFTVPTADERGIEALGYNAAADRRSWKAMQIFFDEIFRE